MDKHVSVLEVGCGTGAVMRKIREENKNRKIILYGVDIDQQALKYANKKSKYLLIAGNGERLPFRDNFFDLVYCHYFLLWVKDPAKILQEMHRVLKRNGYCAVIAEPNYTEMQAKPESLWNLAEKQRKILCEAGADISIGQKSAIFFDQAGFTSIETGQYENYQKGFSYLKQEINQMLVDTETKKFVIDPNTEYYYNVPTYFVFGRKG